MRKFILLFLITFLALILAVPATASPVNPVFIDGPQDRLLLVGDNWHELGNAFPADELIISNSCETEDTSCIDPNGPQDNPQLINYRVAIQNMTNTYWHDLHYVADLDVTTITNYDGWIGNAGKQDEWLAFKIDNIGLNKPLLFESMTPDLIFEPGENWQFILQDYTNMNNVSPHLFASLGIAGASLGAAAPDLSSGGSIIAKPVPIPGSGILIGSALLGLLALKRRRKN